MAEGSALRKDLDKLSESVHKLWIGVYVIAGAIAVCVGGYGYEKMLGIPKAIGESLKQQGTADAIARIEQVDKDMGKLKGLAEDHLTFIKNAERHGTVFIFRFSKNLRPETVGENGPSLTLDFKEDVFGREIEFAETPAVVAVAERYIWDELKPAADHRLGVEVQVGMATTKDCKVAVYGSENNKVATVSGYIIAVGAPKTVGDPKTH